MSGRFEEVITTRQRLREIVPEPAQPIVDKVIDHIDDVCRRFIAASPFAVIATRGTDGMMDLSPKGDPAGFVTVLDDKTLIIPDRLGNRRVDSFENLLTNPEIGMIFVIPGYGYTLRVSGTGCIIRDAGLQEKLAVNGKAPDLLLVVQVKEAFMHCAKSITRSSLWQSDAWPDTKGVPSLAEAMVSHGELSRTVAEQQAVIDTDFDTRMY